MNRKELGNPIALLAIALIFLSTTAAQEREPACRFRFAVAEQIRPGRWGVWPEDARKWWGEEGRRKEVP